MCDSTSSNNSSISSDGIDRIVCCVTTPHTLYQNYTVLIINRTLHHVVSICLYRFCVGDRFYLCENKILCEYDYEERMIFATMPYNYNALTQIKKQAQSLSDDVSSGYGSPSPNSL